MQLSNTDEKENNVAINVAKAEVASGSIIKTIAASNLMVLTQAAKTRVEDRKNAEGVIKPENDPFWNARSVEKDERLAHNPTTVAIRAQAVSKLLQPTSAYLNGARKKAEEEAQQKAQEAKEKAVLALTRLTPVPDDCGVSVIYSYIHASPRMIMIFYSFPKYTQFCDQFSPEFNQ
jgi:hypothetical protein